MPMDLSCTMAAFDSGRNTSARPNTATAAPSTSRKMVVLPSAASTSSLGWRTAAFLFSEGAGLRPLHLTLLCRTHDACSDGMFRLALQRSRHAQASGLVQVFLRFV